MMNDPGTVPPVHFGGHSARERFWQGFSRGFMCRCPQCGQRTLFRAYLKVHPVCATCGLALGEFRSDDAPPYFTIFIVGHIIGPAILAMEKAYSPPMWIHMALWLPLTLGLTLGLLPLIKGAVIGTQWALRIKG